jgi:hypothetical protein
MIEHIAKYSRQNKITYIVYYKSGYRRKYKTNDNLPDSVLNVLLNGQYFSKYITAGDGTITKYERFINA